MFLKTKLASDGSFDKIKARLVGGGSIQREDTYDEISSPMVGQGSIMLG
jgi:hypothetical protein